MNLLQHINAWTHMSYATPEGKVVVDSTVSESNSRLSLKTLPGILWGDLFSSQNWWIAPNNLSASASAASNEYTLSANQTWCIEMDLVIPETLTNKGEQCGIVIADAHQSSKYWYKLVVEQLSASCIVVAKNEPLVQPVSADAASATGGPAVLSKTPIESFTQDKFTLRLEINANCIKASYCAVPLASDSSVAPPSFVTVFDAPQQVFSPDIPLSILLTCHGGSSDENSHTVHISRFSVSFSS